MRGRKKRRTIHCNVCHRRVPVTRRGRIEYHDPPAGLGVPSPCPASDTEYQPYLGNRTC